ncbi:MAG TPA: protein translocase subunit SecF [Bryobacteraceae bacterium]|jgi:preprotein translocase subunit SecF|nr:protein translocase subunit SecF [Bryobacteraceae bacterium]
MELFKQTNFDFLRWKWPFIIASLVLSAAGLVSLAVKGGPRYGIEFKGGMVMTVKFASAPPVEQVRSVLTKVLASPPSVETFEQGSNEIQIGTEGGDDVTLAKNRTLVVDTLAKTFGQPGNGKLDLNNASKEDLANRLRDPLQKAGVALSDPQINDLAAAIMGYRDQHQGLITNLNDLHSVAGVTPQVMTVLNQEAYAAPYTAVRAIEIVGPQVGAELRSQALNATLLALAGMLVYIWFRFEWIYGVAAVIAVFHDTIITIGLFSLLNKEITLTVIAALLTLVGYSMNDTIVIFDRIRENLHLNRREPLVDVINRSVNQTLSRTVMTSGLTFLTVVALFLFGGPVLHGFSLALVLGILVGTYSSVFVASPIVLGWHDFADKRRKTLPPPAPAAGGTKAASGVKSASSLKQTAAKPVKAVKQG